MVEWHWLTGDMMIEIGMMIEGGDYGGVNSDCDWPFDCLTVHQQTKGQYNDMPCWTILAVKENQYVE